MKYFTPQLWININRTRGSKGAMKAWDRNLATYIEHLRKILTGLGARGRDFFQHISLHDGTLLRMEIGDHIDATGTIERFEINDRRASVRLFVLSREGSLFTLRYKAVNKVELKF